MYVGDTISGKKDENMDNYINVCAVDKEGKSYNHIENLSRFCPLYDNIVIGENERFYFADKNGNPISNDSYHRISVPPYTYAPGYPCFWTFLCSPAGGENFSFSITTSYINEQRTVASVLDKLTDSGIGELKIGQSSLELIEKFKVNKVPIRGEFNLGYEIQGNNWFRAICSVGMLPPDGEVGYIKINFISTMLPIENAQEKISKAITTYLDGLRLKKIEGGEEIDYYSASQRTYEIINFKKEGTIYLMSLPMMEKIFGLD